MRTRIIRDTADIYRPDLFIVDKEPTGLRGEVLPALHLLKERGTPLVLGLRDVMDDPAALAIEWERKNVVPALRDLYDEIWIYGLPQINKPLTGIEVPPSVRHKMVYTGYLYRDLPLHSDIPHEIEEIDGPFILVTAGGGGDGADLIDWVLAAYESDPHIPYGAVIVFGPFMSANEREAFKERATKFRNIRTLTFTNNLGALMQRAEGVVAMGGYNTFCEILSFDKKAIIVPRTRPRLEQFIRARAARNVGLIEMLDAGRGRDPHAMATALRQLPQQGLPSDVVVPGLLDGLGNVWRLVAKQLARPQRGPAPLEAIWGGGETASADPTMPAAAPSARART
jgi:predicted glycosyltransferase